MRMVFSLAIPQGGAKERFQLSPDIPEHKLIHLNLAEFDPPLFFPLIL